MPSHAANDGWPPAVVAHVRSLPAYEPLKLDFKPVYEAALQSPPDAQAEAWMQQARVLCAPDLLEVEKDYRGAAALYQQAANRSHAQAWLELSRLQMLGLGTPRHAALALQSADRAAWLGSVSAYWVLGQYSMKGWGLPQDTERAYALWQHAALLGSAQAQEFLGAEVIRRLEGQDLQQLTPPQHKFVQMALQMLTSALAQGQGDAALYLGLWACPAAWAARAFRLHPPFTSRFAKPPAGPAVSIRDEGSPQALALWQQGVMLGSALCAQELQAYFAAALPLDPARAERHGVLAQALARNSDLRLPNLDKVLPLPAAPLPKWDGDPQKLIDAAKPLAPLPLAKPTPGSSRTGRAHIPPGHVLPQDVGQAPLDEYGNSVPFQYETARALVSGYWYPSVGNQTEGQRAFAVQAQPLLYNKGEFFDNLREGRLSSADGRIFWQYRGLPIKLAEPAAHPKEAQGLARYTRIPQPGRYCNGASTCPATGVWLGRADDADPLAAVFNRWDRQAYVSKGQSFPDPAQLHLAIPPQQITWLYLGHANELNASGLAEVSVETVQPQTAGAA